ncbi:hypothetical protein Mapa_004133 [Marchantia paleacea]|nr:hypothetical protein Mapa_004133 [Marchantia paleacea]
MDLYPEELRTPPMALVALVGMPELHSAVSLSLQKEEPPLNTLAIPEFCRISIIGGKERKAADARMPPPLGILKADWLAKHRTRSAAVLAILLSCDQVYGDHSQWLQICSHIDSVNVIRGRNTKLVIAVVQPSLKGEINETRMTVLRKRAELDAKNCFVFISHDPGELKRSLLRLGSIMGELANQYYKEEGRRIQNRIERKSYSSVELSVRYSFKVAVYAEFRRKWVKALKFYEIAYSLLQEIIKAHMELLPIQRTVELKAVAEHLHFKISTLLLHSGKEGEAVKWFRQHIVRYKCLIGPPEGAFLHWAWVCKQFQVFAELLDNSLATASLPPAAGQSTGSPVTIHELQPGYYLQVAASYMVLRRRFFESAFATIQAFEEEGGVDYLAGPPEDIGPPLFIGQASRLLKRGNNFDVQRPTEAEFMRHVISVEKSFAHSNETICLLRRAQQHFKQIQAVRIINELGSEIGREYYNSRDYEKAKGLFDSVAGMYRTEAWIAVLGATLGYLRECARQLGQLQAYVEYALELASLPVPATYGQDVQHLVVSGPEVGPAGPLSQFLREQVHKEVIGLMQGTTSVLPAREDENGMAVTSQQPVALELDLSSPLRIFLSATVVFHEQIVKPGVQTYMTLSLLTHLPLSLVLLELEVHFNQRECSFVFKNSKNALEDEQTASTESLPVKGHCDLELEPNKWKRLTVDIIPNFSGKLDCLAVVARIGPYATVRCQVDGPAFRDGNRLWNYEPVLDTSPVKPSNLAYFGKETLLVEEAEPLVQVELLASGPGLVGEAFPVQLVVTSTGHPMECGEMDVYLGTSDLSPAATVGNKLPLITAKSEPSPPELLCASAEGEEAYIEFSGPLQIPSLGPDEKWNTTVYLRWIEPKDVNLMVLLYYETKESLSIDEPGTPAARRRVQKILHLRCEEALDVSYQYFSRFRTDALLPGSLAAEQPTPVINLPLDEASILVVTTKNSSTLAVNLRSINLALKDVESWSVRKSGTGGDSGGILLSPEEVHEQLFYVRPLVPSSAHDVGTIEIFWHREQSHETSNLSQAASNPATPVCRLFLLAPVAVESPPLVVTFKCPPHALLGVPFVCSMSIQNMTTSLQEVSFSVYDTQSFIFAGAHSDTFSILPKSTSSLSYKLVPIASGMQQLPQLRFTATRYNAGFQPSALSTQLFVHPAASGLNPQKTCQPESEKPGIAVAN